MPKVAYNLPTLYEDEYLVCTFNDVCTIIAIDDVNSKGLDNRFDKELDTFNLVD